MKKVQKIIDFIKWQQESAKSVWLNYWSWKPGRIYFFIWLPIIVANLIFGFLIFRSLSQDVVIIHYNVIFGIDLVGNPIKIFNLPFVAMIISIINTAIASVWYSKDRLLCHINQIATIFINIILILGLYAINLTNSVNIKL